MRLPRLYRFLKIMKLIMAIKVLNKFPWYQKLINNLKMNGSILRMISGVIGVIVLMHLVACFWYLSAKSNDFDPDTWVYRK